MKATTLALLIALAPAPPASAEAAFALGSCDHNGYIYGFSRNNASRAMARDQAIGDCEHHGGKECQILNDDLHLLCFAFAEDKSRWCGRYGMAFYPNLAKTEYWAVEDCRRHGGKRCRLMFARCDQGENVGADGFTLPPAPCTVCTDKVK